MRRPRFPSGREAQKGPLTAGAANISMSRFADLPLQRLAVHGETTGFCASAVVACVPARNEAQHVSRCLAALDAELEPGDGVLLAANGCADATLETALGLTTAWSRPWLVLDCDWRDGHGTAPLARRLVMGVASRLAPQAVLLSVDADTVVLPGLRAGYAEEFDRGFDLVCGRIGFLADEAALLPVADPENERIIREYRETSRHIAALVDPDPLNPWPHHGNIGGANFAVRGAAYRRAGPLPTPAFGEDRALRRRFEAFNMRIRYSDRPRVETSCRLVGRAPGGLADELRRNRTETDPIVDEALEPPEVLHRRCRSRAAFRDEPCATERELILRALDLAPRDIERLAKAGGIGSWQEAEDLSPALRQVRLRLSDLRRFLPELRALLRAVRDARSDNPSFPRD